MRREEEQTEKEEIDEEKMRAKRARRTAFDKEDNKKQKRGE